MKPQKNDAADAAAISGAVSRTMRFVAVKAPEQQSVMMLPSLKDVVASLKSEIGRLGFTYLFEPISGKLSRNSRS
ncbi:hypothetical protein [Mesorhizobium sp. ANAO-SY3R2]|uniref:hypothetical protein n=1 Tax=Mesorhizobium sp. ANAO-SY3R2 TaxID=3166644 RepID=UPI00366CA15B